NAKSRTSRRRRWRYCRCSRTSSTRKPIASSPSPTPPPDPRARAPLRPAAAPTGLKSRNLPMHASYTLRADIRPLAAGDLEEVVAIDAAIERRSRQPYFERRLQSARREPKLHAQFAAIDGKGI